MACQCPSQRESAPAVSENTGTEPAVSARSESGERAPRWAATMPSAPRERRWYGWQILIPDLAGSLLSGIGAFVPGAGGAALLITGSTVAFFGGPIVHWAHGHVGRGFASMFGLRLGLPLVGGLVGFGLGSLGGSAGALLGFGLGTSVLALTGIIVDIAALAYDEPASSVVTARAHRPARTWAVAPFGTFDPIRGAAIAGISGAF